MTSFFSFPASCPQCGPPACEQLSSTAVDTFPPSNHRGYASCDPQGRPLKVRYMAVVRYPIDPLVAASGQSPDALRRSLGVSGATWSRAVAEGATEAQADRWAVAVGLVPWLLWDNWLEDVRPVCASDDCAQPFWPTLGHGDQQRYCSATCKRREKMRRYRARTSGRSANAVHAANYRAYLKQRRAA